MHTLRLSFVLLICAISAQSIAQQKVEKEINMFCSAKIPQSNAEADADTANPRGLIDQYYLWKPGTVLKVKIFNGSKQLRDLVIEAAREWEKHANIRFQFVDYGTTNIRILLAEGLGHNSSLGIQNNNVPEDQQTMNIDTSNFFDESGRFYGFQYKGTVMHELGHAIGFLHEHFSPVSGIKWNKEAVYNDIMASDGWTKEQIDYNLFQQFAVSYTNGTSYDNKSLMHYYVKPNWTFDGYAVKSNYVLSDGDKATARAAYPLNPADRKVIVPVIHISGFMNSQMVDNPEKGGFSYYPEFNIETEGRTGKVMMIAYILDEDYEFVPHAQNPEKIVGVSRVFNIPPGMPYSLNKPSRDIEFFVPYSAINMEPGVNKFNVYFVVKLIDDNEVKSVMKSTPVAFSKTIR